MDLHALCERARESPGLTFVPELDAWLVSRHDDVREVLGRPREFSSAGALRPDYLPGPAALSVLATGYGGVQAVLTADGDAHRRLRRPLTRGLSPSRVAAVTPFIRRRAAELLDRLSSPAEWMSAYARPLPASVIGRLFGLDPAELSAAILGGLRAEELLFSPLAEAEQVAAANDVVALQVLLDAAARDRLTAPHNDLVTEMVRGLAPEATELTVDQRREIVSNLQNLLLAGHLTTTALLGTTLLHLLRDRAQWELLCARPSLVAAAIEEAVRFEAPVQGFRRTVTAPVTLAGTALEAGDVVFVSYASAGWDGGPSFDITRPGAHLSFGHGVHTCPGSSLAREQVRITLELLIERLPGLRLADGEVSMLPTLIHRGPSALHLEW